MENSTLISLISFFLTVGISIMTYVVTTKVAIAEINKDISHLKELYASELNSLRNYMEEQTVAIESRLEKNEIGMEKLTNTLTDLRITLEKMSALIDNKIK